MNSPTSRVDGAPHDALAAFAGKWRARWPEWTIAEVFVPRSQRDAALAWAVLQQELTDAAWGGSDPLPGEAKLLWWQEELRGWAAGRRRHPLGSVLQRIPAPWTELSGVLPALAAARERPHDLEHARSTLVPFARVVATIDGHVSGGGGTGSVAEADVAAVTATLLHARSQIDGDGHVPLTLLAQAGDADPVALHTRQLAGDWPVAAATTRIRRLWAALSRARLERAGPRSTLPHWRALMVAWRAARGGRG